MKTYKELGQVTLGSYLRRLADEVTQDVEHIYSKFGFEIDPKWFPVFYVLATETSDSVVNIAKEIGHSHVSVSKIVKEMNSAGLIETRKSENDSRKTLISLSPRAKKMIPAMQQQCDAVDKITSELTSDTGINLWEAIKISQRHLKFNPLSARIDETEAPKKIRVVDYAPIYKDVFKKFNLDWISQHWEIEEPDRNATDNPDSYILDKGGAILIALNGNEPAGCCALLRMDADNFELAKMAVPKTMQGKGIGLLLGNAILQRAKDLGARRVYLESNSILTPAVNLYSKLGFKHIEGGASPYDRCNVQMEKHV